MAGMILREMKHGKIYGGRVDMGMTTMVWKPITVSVNSFDRHD
jgi:hypothetical protein